MGTLIIENVDLEKLDGDRLLLMSVLLDGEVLERLTVTQIDAIDSIQNMLDDWSDDRYFDKKE